MRRTSYQKGSLRLADRKKGKVWEFLWREVQLDGTIRRKHIVIGTQEDLPTESSAQATVDAIRLEINQQTPQRLIKSISFQTLVKSLSSTRVAEHFQQNETGARCGRRRSQIVIPPLFFMIQFDPLRRKPFILLASPTGFEPVLPP